MSHHANHPLGRREVLFATVSLLAAGVTRTARAAGEARGAGEANDVTAALTKVAKARAQLRTLVGPFTQERTIGLLAQSVRSTGTLTLIRPDRLRWELSPPDAIVYWVGPEGLAYQSKRGHGRMALGAASSKNAGRLAAALDDIRTVLGGDLGRLRDRYDLRLLTASPALSFSATPLPNNQAHLERIEFTLDAEHACPVRTTLIEGPRDRTEIVFGKLAINTPIDPASVRPSF